MSSLVAKYVAKKILKETSKNHFGKEDPKYDKNPVPRNDRDRDRVRHGRVTKESRPGLTVISKRDAKILKKARRRAYIIDNGLFNVCGMKVGYGAIIGLIPVVGDFFDFFMALMVISTCRKIDGGLPDDVKNRMLLRAVFDTAIGFVPFVGDLADAYYKCNVKNVHALEDLLEARGDAIIAAQREAQQTGNPSIPRNDEPGVGAPPSYVSDDLDMAAPAAAPAPTAAAPGRTRTTRTHESSRPEARGTVQKSKAKSKSKNNRSGRGWFGGDGGAGTRERDLEAAVPMEQPSAHRTERSRYS
ncbi:MAG: hypothetical protein M1832_004267 [Thelocarpon impressellum]|nr:MAG: hypothetical protein M1832_004267 [Thelocarpon impressellum]